MAFKFIQYLTCIVLLAAFVAAHEGHHHSPSPAPTPSWPDKGHDHHSPSPAPTPSWPDMGHHHHQMAPAPAPEEGHQHHMAPAPSNSSSAACSSPAVVVGLVMALVASFSI